MKTSANETREIEAYLLGTHPAEAVVMEARLLLDQDLREKTAWQQKTYGLIQAYGRKKLRSEIEAAHNELFTIEKHVSFRKKVMELFKR